jgi:hypothetical protein
MIPQNREQPQPGRIVIGAGERDEAPMLFIGEKLGLGGGAVDIAVDPVESTNLVAKGAAQLDRDGLRRSRRQHRLRRERNHQRKPI